MNPLMARLPAALRERMQANRHTQSDVEAATGVPQPQISRALKGLRKRPTEPMQKLCQYAFIENDDSGRPTLAELSALLHKIVGGHPAAAECVKGVLQSLAPLLTSTSGKKSG